MPTPSSGTIRFSDIRSEIQGSNSNATVRFSDYYKGRSTPTLLKNASVPTSGVIRLSNFRDVASNAIVAIPPNNSVKYSGGDWFGQDLITNGTYIAASAPFEPIIADGKHTLGAVYIFNSTTGSLIHTLYNPNANSITSSVVGRDDNFGWTGSIGINSTKVAVGARAESNSVREQAGRVYVFNLSNGQLLWQLENPANNCTYFGTSVKMTEEYIIVGAPGFSTLAEDGGKVHIFSATTGQFIRTINNPTTSSYTLFGTYLETNNTYFVTSQFPNTLSGISSGLVHIFNISNGSLLRTITNPNQNPNSLPPGDSDGFARGKLAISNTYVTVSAPNEDTVSGETDGWVYVFRIADGVKVAGFNNPNSVNGPAGVADDYFGRGGISMNDSVVAVAATGEAAASGSTLERLDSGTVYIFNISTNSLQATFTNPNAFDLPRADKFGRNTSISGNTLIVAAEEEDANSGTFISGKVYSYNLTTNTKTLTIDNPNIVDSVSSFRFGYSVLVNDNWTIASATDAPGGGVAYVYRTSNLQFHRAIVNPNMYQLPSYMYQGDSFGISMALHANTVAISAQYDETNGEVDGVNRKVGVVHVFDVNTGTKLYTLEDPAPYSGQTASRGSYGLDVAISNNYVVVSAPYEFGSSLSQSQSGRVYVYNSENGSLIRTINNPNVKYTEMQDQFGVSLSLLGTTLVVGAPGERNIVSDSIANAGNEGAVYVFNVTTGSLIRRLIDPDPWAFSGSSQYSGNRFGGRVLAKGNYILVSSERTSANSAWGAGRVHVYDFSTGNYLRTLNNPNDNTPGASMYKNYDGFGYLGTKMDILGNLAFIGAPNEDSLDAPSSDTNNNGIVYIFDLTTGNLVRTIRDPNEFGSLYVSGYANVTRTNLFGWANAVANNYMCISSALGAESLGGAGGVLYRYYI